MFPDLFMHFNVSSYKNKTQLKINLNNRKFNFYNKSSIQSRAAPAVHSVAKQCHQGFGLLPPHLSFLPCSVGPAQTNPPPGSNRAATGAGINRHPGQ